MSSRDKLDAAIESARRDWMAAFDNNIKALTGDSQHGQLTASVVIFGGIPKHITCSPETRKEIGAPRDGARS